MTDTHDSSLDSSETAPDSSVTARSFAKGDAVSHNGKNLVVALVNEDGTYELSNAEGEPYAYYTGIAAKDVAEPLATPKE